MKGSLFFDLLNVIIFFSIILGICVYVLTIDFEPKVQKEPFTKISAKYSSFGIGNTLKIKIDLKNDGDTNVVLEPKINYDKDTIKLLNHLDPIVLKSKESKSLNLTFKAIKGIFCNEGVEKKIEFIFNDVIHNKNITLDVVYKIKTEK